MACVGNFLHRKGSPIPARVVAHAQRLRRGTETERTVFFSDAVFAIAMTLLVLELKLPALDPHISAAEFQHVLADQVEPFAAFILSFILVGRLWMSHHQKFVAIKNYDSALQGINLTALFFVVFLPVPTSLLFQASIQSPWPPIIYALTISGSFVSLSLLWAHAHRAKLMHGWIDPALYRLVLHGTDPVVVVFVLSIPVAFISPEWAMYSWILIWPLSMVHGKWRLAEFNRAVQALQADDAGNGAQESVQES